MNFRRRGADEPEINLIPFIDVLLVVLIFLMLSTTYSKYAELQVRLPEANAEPERQRPREVVVSIAADGRYAIDKKPLPGRSIDALTLALQTATQGVQDPIGR
jgi:biopolymer transport protein ExbD